MEKISYEEFITYMYGEQSPFRDGYDLGLIIDESNGLTDRVDRAVQEMSKEIPTLSLPIDALLKPSELQEKISAANREETLVFLTTNEALTTSHYEQLQSLVSIHALEAWRNQGTEREMVRFLDTNRFVLVVSRNVFEDALKTFPPIWNILGASLSLDDARDAGGK